MFNNPAGWYGAFVPFPICFPHVSLYEAGSLHMCVLPYKIRKILDTLLKLIKLCEITIL